MDAEMSAGGPLLQSKPRPSGLTSPALISSHCRVTVLMVDRVMGGRTQTHTHTHSHMELGAK